MKKLIVSFLFSFCLTIEAAPTFRSSTNGTASTGAPTATLPTGHALNDILLLGVETSNQSISAPTGYTQITNSPQGTGTGAAVNSVGLQMFWKRDNGSEVAPTIPDSGDHTIAFMLAYSGCTTTGTPYVAGQGAVITPAQTNPSFTFTPAVIQKGGMLVAIIADGFDTNTAMSSPVLTGSGNVVLGATTARCNNQFATGTGGGFRTQDASFDCVDATGTYTYSLTYANSALYASIGFVLLPPASSSGFFDFFKRP